MDVRPSRTAKTLTALALFVFLPLILVVGAVMYRAGLRSPEESAALNQARSRISQCERVQGDVLQDLRTRREARSDCERIAREYEAAWGSPP
jgi:hypothetical protein